jgi:hypothetical protein
VQHEPHDPELLIEVADTADPDGLHVLTLPEVKALAETLLIEYLKAASLIPAARDHRRRPRGIPPEAGKRSRAGEMTAIGRCYHGRSSSFTAEGSSALSPGKRATGRSAKTVHHKIENWFRRLRLIADASNT